mmetsp:Transcript_29764/g.81587  ORF Transcript_29764/g.81587 Transcript_29764/m.81587 type:complete len:282 (+) Transcript_29764:810-1655(+)
MSRGREEMSAIWSPARFDAALHANTAQYFLADAVPEIGVPQQLAIPAHCDEAAVAVEPYGVPVAFSEVHLFARLFPFVQGDIAGKHSVYQDEFILSRAPLDVVYWAFVCGCNYAVLLPIRPHEVQIRAAIIILARVIDLHRSLDEQRSACVVPIHGYALRLEEGLSCSRLLWIVEVVSLTFRRTALRLCDANRDVWRRCACATRGHLEGHDARRGNLGHPFFPVQRPCHDLDSILHHSAAEHLVAGPFERRPTGVELFQCEREPKLAGPRVPNANVVAAIF